MYMSSFHWILFAIQIDTQTVWIYDSLRQDKSMYQDLIDLINKAWFRFLSKHLKMKDDQLGPLDFRTDKTV